MNELLEQIEKVGRMVDSHEAILQKQSEYDNQAKRISEFDNQTKRISEFDNQAKRISESELGLI